MENFNTWFEIGLAAITGLLGLHVRSINDQIEDAKKIAATAAKELNDFKNAVYQSHATRQEVERMYDSFKDDINKRFDRLEEKLDNIGKRNG